MRNGSSPHARGTYQLSALLSPIYRFIPARTGNMWTMTAAPTDRPVHPRTHGEHAGRLLENVQHIGSSPHARGTFVRLFGNLSE